MITLDEAKILCGLGSDSDTLINLVLPLVEDLIIEYTNNDFTQPDTNIVGTADGTATILIENNTVLSGKIYIDGLGVRNIVSGDSVSIILDESVEAGTVTFRVMRIPKGLKLIAAQLVKYHISKRTIGVASESFFDYSVAYRDDIPIWLYKDLNRYSKYKY